MRSRSRFTSTATPSATLIPPRAGRPAPGPGDRPGQRQPQSPNRSWRAVCPASRPSTATRWPRSINHTGGPQLPRRGQHHHGPLPRWLFSPPFSTGSDASNRRPPSPVSPFSPLTATTIPEFTTAIAHLREVLGDQTYESLARKGETMTTAAMVTYAYDQIDQARTELEEPS